MLVIRNVLTMIDAAGLDRITGTWIAARARKDADAAHAQEDTAQIIAGKVGWDYLITLERNQPSLCEAVAAKIHPLLPEAPHDVVEEYHRGRMKGGPAGAPVPAGSTFRTSSRLPVFAARISKYPAATSAKNTP